MRLFPVKLPNGRSLLLTGALHGLHLNDGVPLQVLIKAMTKAPAKILGLETGALAEGAPADFALFDEDMVWTVDEDTLRSKSDNTPFDERMMQGRVIKTVVAGQTVFELEA